MYFVEWKLYFDEDFTDMKFVPKDPVDDKSTFVQVTAWRQTGVML